MTQADVRSSPGGATTWRLSSGYIKQPTWICFRLLMHRIPCARILAWLSAGKSIAARIAMIAITTSSSIRVKAFVLFRIPPDESEEFGRGRTDRIGNGPVVDHAALGIGIESAPGDRRCQTGRLLEEEVL